jgi:flavin-binding protein dodecin
MKIISLLIACSILLSGCARKSELEAARENLAEAQRKIDTLENERVSKTKYDVARASLKLADERIAALERELKLAQEQAVLLASAQPTSDSAGQPSVVAPDRPTTSGLIKGTYEVANETHVYSPDAELNFGQHLRISSPTGLMVSDPEHKVVGGDLSIKSKDMVMGSPDGILTTAADGSVNFIGKTLTMKFDDKKTPQTETPEISPPSNLSPTSGGEATAPESSVPPSTTSGVESRGTP